jgi:hypothetical protein
MWGNFQTDYASNEMAQVDRGLYGANAEWKADATTAFGERRTVVSGFAAEPGTIGGRDEFRGTGGSLFYLRNQDVLGGSERLRIEMRDKDSQLVTGTVELRPGLDYDIDYLQGRILLSQPLSSSGSDNMLVRDGGLSGDEAWLVARYEYAPGFDEIDTLTTGGRAHMWINDHVGLGLTGSRSSGDADDNSVLGADLTLRKTTDTWLKLQGGRTQGLVSNSLFSNDGGFGFVGNDPVAFADAEASSYRADFSLGIGDVFKSGKGRVTLYTQSQDAGYSAPGLATTSDRSYYGGTLDLPIGEKLSVVGKADHREQMPASRCRPPNSTSAYQLNDRWNLAAGVRNDKRETCARPCHSPRSRASAPMRWCMWVTTPPASGTRGASPSRRCRRMAIARTTAAWAPVARCASARSCAWKPKLRPATSARADGWAPATWSRTRPPCISTTRWRTNVATSSTAPT